MKPKFTVTVPIATTSAPDGYTPTPEPTRKVWKKVFIIKIQLPMNTGARREPTHPLAPEVLVYNQDRTIQQILPVDESILDFMSGYVKVFVWAWLDSKQRLRLEGLAP